MSRLEVMVPCYNYGRYLRQCVESVLGQSHRDVRVVIVDDASSDNTQAVATALALQDRRVDYRRHAANIGHIATYNECIDQAGGDAMLILSADDFLLPGAVERAMRILDTAPEVGFTPGETWLFGAGYTLPEPKPYVERTDSAWPSWVVEYLSTGNPIGSASAIVRTSVQKAIGHYRSDLPHTADLEMWLRFALYSRICFIEAHQAVYRRHEANMSYTYDAVADLDQSMAAFDPHYAAIRALPDGLALEGRVRTNFQRRREAIERGDVAPVQK